MKKSLILIFIALITCPLLFSGCSGGKTIEDVYTPVNDFLITEKVIEIQNNSIDYGTNVNNAQSDNNSQYYILTHYENLLKFTLTPLITFNTTFDGFTVIKNAYRQNALCSNFIQKFDTFKTQLDSFYEEKETFITTTTNNSLTGFIALDELNSFEKEFGKLINTANQMQLAYMEAYNTLFGGIDALSNASTSKNAVGALFSEMLNTYINFAVLEFNYIIPDTTTYDYSNFKNKLELLNNKLQSQSFTTANYETWKNYYTNYKNEQTMFLGSLHAVNLKTTSNSSNQVYYDQIIDFVSKNAGLFIDKTLELLGATNG